MRITHFILALFFLYPLSVQSAQWVNLDSVLPDESFTDVFAIGNHVWITSGSSTELFYSSDRGSTTFTIYDTPDEFLTIHMLNANDGYAGAQNGNVYKTSDGGENWTVLFPLTGNTVSSITFPPSGAEPGYTAGEVGKIYSITSTGTTAMITGVVANLISISFPVSSTEGWACGEDLILHFSNNQWTGQGAPSGTRGAIFFVDNTRGWVVGSDGKGDGSILHTTNGGLLWSLQTDPSPSSGTLTSVFFLNAMEGWAVGNSGRVIHTTNGGTTWSVVNLSASNLLRSVHFVSQNNGYIVGNFNNAFKYTDTLPPTPKAQVDKNNIYFGEIAIGDHKDEVITLSNTGTADLIVGTVAQGNPIALPFSKEVDNCSGQTLTPSSTCTITTRFTPTTHSDSSDTFDIPTNATPSTLTISLNSGVKPFAWGMFMPACAKPK
ncbi:MAG: hypothetical protein GY705_21615 [Bacteroidetes bacterium]|nr:hypothetical protein [Bacteroidota bacterium]